MQSGRSTAPSRVRQIKSFFDTLESDGDPINTLGKFGDPDMDVSSFALERTDAVLHFPHIIAQRIHCASDVVQMLRNDIIRLGHNVRLA
jgi:hypothetical protein